MIESDDISNEICTKGIKATGYNQLEIGVLGCDTIVILNTKSYHIVAVS